MNDVFYLYYDDNEVLLCVTKILPYCIEEAIYGTKPDSLESCSKTPSYVLPAFLCKQEKQSATNFSSLKQEAYKMRAGGESIREIAAALDVSPTTIQNWLKQAN